MIITKAFVTYRCEQCNTNYMLKFAPLPPGDIIKVNDSIDKTKQCTVCTRHMRIQQVVFKIAQNLYGNDLYGYWYCPVHAAFVYYPSLMRKAERDQLATDIVSDMAERYRKVAADGFPWVCPGCGQKMIYREDKRNHTYNA